MGRGEVAEREDIESELAAPPDLDYLECGMDILERLYRNKYPLDTSRLGRRFIYGTYVGDTAMLHNGVSTNVYLPDLYSVDSIQEVLAAVLPLATNARALSYVFDTAVYAREDHSIDPLTTWEMDALLLGTRIIPEQVDVTPSLRLTRPPRREVSLKDKDIYHERSLDLAAQLGEAGYDAEPLFMNRQGQIFPRILSVRTQAYLLVRATSEKKLYFTYSGTIPALSLAASCIYSSFTFVGLYDLSRPAAPVQLAPSLQLMAKHVLWPTVTYPS